MIDFTTLQANPIPPPILQLQEQNEMLQEKNKVFEKVIFGTITAGVLILIIYIIKDANTRTKK